MNNNALLHIMIFLFLETSCIIQVGWKIAILLQQQQHYVCFFQNPSIIELFLLRVHGELFVNPLKNIFFQVCILKRFTCTKSMIIRREGQGFTVPTNRHVVLCYIFCFCFISIIVHLKILAREREKKIRHVMCKKLEKPKKAFETWCKLFNFQF